MDKLSNGTKLIMQITIEYFINFLMYDANIISTLSSQICCLSVVSSHAKGKEW